MNERLLSLLLLIPAFSSLTAKDAPKEYVSKVWVADLGNGMYQNPVLNADYSDPDICRVGEDYYLTSSSFNCLPGLQILHSKDLVNWKIIGSAIPTTLLPSDVYSKPQHGNGVWAPCISYHSNQFFIYWGDPDFGIFVVKAPTIEGPWTAPQLVKAGKGLIDPAPLWDDDGRIYLSHAYAGSRAEIKSILAVLELDSEGLKAITDSRIVFDGHDNHPTIEGTKFHKRNGYYYIFAPGGGVATGWQVVLRSKTPYGPYQDRIVLAQGSSPINGPHQGAWIDTPTGEDWFVHFQDKDAYGRVMHLQPMSWKEDWPVIGVDKDGDGTGEPVLTYKKPNVGKIYPICTPQEDDEFTGFTLSPQWQWHANPSPKWAYFAGEKGYARLYSVSIPKEYKNLMQVPNLMLQKMPAEKFTATLKMEFKPTKQYFGERTGLLVMGLDYALLSLENTEQGLILSQNECLKAKQGTEEVENEKVTLTSGVVWLRVEVKAGCLCTFSYSTTGKGFKKLGVEFKAAPGQWIGAKIGTFCTRNKVINDGGWTELDWFRITK